ncbi:MAG: symmetrical bis(5'-nucleosyl)-tetraphosphatase [Buchnera aphidicola (Nurudea yanoniella)]
MSTYFVGDIHGCYYELMKLLEKISFDEKLDYLWSTGDLINRGPNSIEVMRFISSLGSHARLVLGNHDLNLIFSYTQNKYKRFNDYIISDILKAKDIDILINWLRKQPLLQIDKKRKIIMVHAGIHPYWDIDVSRMYSDKLGSFLCNINYDILLRSIFNNAIVNYIDNSCRKLNRLSFSLNVFTRMRYCFNDGTLDMECKKSPSIDTYPLIPWFSIKNNSLQDYILFFGHWASLKKNIVSPKIISLDTGCCWGGYLSMFRLEDSKWFSQPAQKRL